MKKLLLILFTLLLAGCVPVLAQTYQPMSGYGYNMHRLAIDSTFIMPNKDTTFDGTYKRAGALVFRTLDNDSTLFVYNGTKWIALGTGSLGDSYLRISHDTLYYRKASGGENAIRLPFANYDSLTNIPDSFLAKHHTHPIYDIIHLQDSLAVRYTRDEIDAILLSKADTGVSYDTATANDLFIPFDFYGQPDGVAPLNGERKIPLVYLPDNMTTPVTYMGTYDGDSVRYTNPDATDSLLPAPDSTNTGYYFNCIDDFTNNSLHYHIGDWIVSDGIAWRRILGSEHDSLWVADSSKYLMKKDSLTTWVSLSQLIDSLANHQGSVTSVNQSVPAWLSVSGGGTGDVTLAITAKSSQTENEVLATPDGSSGAVSLRALVSGDIPSLSASKITSGTFSTARLGTGTAASGKYLDGTGAWTTLPTASTPTLSSVTHEGNTTDSSMYIRKGTDSIHLGNNGNIIISGSITAAGGGFDSDKRLKKNISHRLPDILGSLKAVSFKWRKKERGDKTHYGYIAQDVQKFLPDAVIKQPNGYLALDYNAIHTLAINQLYQMVKQQQKEIKKLQKEIKKLKRK